MFGRQASLACFLRRGDEPHLRSGCLIRLGQASPHGLAQAGYIKIGAEGPAQIAIDDPGVLGRPQPEKQAGCGLAARGAAAAGSASGRYCRRH